MTNSTNPTTTNPTTTTDEVEALRIICAVYRERVLAAYDKLVSDLQYAAPEVVHERLYECRYVFEHVFDQGYTSE